MVEKGEQTRGGAAGEQALAFELPRVKPAERERAGEILRALEERYPDARCALHYSTPAELLVATILSAQCTDVAVNKATPALFARFPTPAAYAAASPEVVEPYVKSLGFFRNKSLAVWSAMKDVAEKFGGEPPRTMEEMLTLRGVARKTANVVLGNAYGINVGVVVDTHIERLSKRLALAPKSASVQAVEKRLMALFPRERWTDLSHLLIEHGRRVCKARGWGCETDGICRRFCEHGLRAVRAERKAPGVKKSAKRKTARKKAPARAAPP